MLHHHFPDDFMAVTEGFAPYFQVPQLRSEISMDFPPSPLPIGSMYALYGSIYHQHTPDFSIYIPYMDPMGYDVFKEFRTYPYEMDSSHPVVMSPCSIRSLASLLPQRLHVLLHLSQGAEAKNRLHKKNITYIYIYICIN